MRSSSPCEAAKERRQSISSAATSTFPQQSPITIQRRRCLRKYKTPPAAGFEGEEEILSHANFTSWDLEGSPQPLSAIGYGEDSWGRCLRDVSPGGPMDFEVRKNTTNPLVLTSVITQCEASIIHEEVSNSTPLRSSMPLPSIESPSTRLSKAFDPEKFEKQLHDIREANPFWFSPFRASTLPPSYESPWTQRSNKTLNPEQFEEHLENIRRENNMFTDLDVFGIHDSGLYDLDWDSTLDAATPSSTGSFEALGINSLVHSTPPYNPFDNLTARSSIHESAEKLSPRDHATNRVSFQEIFNIYQEPQIQPSSPTKRQREASSGHGRSINYCVSQQESPQCIPKNQKSSSSGEYPYPNTLTTTTLKHCSLCARASQDKVNHSSSASSSPMKRRRVDSAQKENATPKTNGGNKTKFSIWSNGRTGATKRRFLRERKTPGALSCIQNQSVAPFLKEDESQNTFTWQDAVLFSSPVKGASNTRGHSNFDEFGYHAKLSELLRTEAEVCAGSLTLRTELAQMNHNKATGNGLCDRGAQQTPFDKNTSDFNFPYLKLSPVSAEQYTTPSLPPTIVNTAIRFLTDKEALEEALIDMANRKLLEESSDHTNKPGCSSRKQDMESLPLDRELSADIARGLEMIQRKRQSLLDRAEHEAQSIALEEAQKKEWEDTPGPNPAAEAQLKSFTQFRKPVHFCQMRDLIMENRNFLEEFESQNQSQVRAQQESPQPQEQPQVLQETLSANGDTFEEFRAHIGPGFSSGELTHPSLSSIQTRRRSSAGGEYYDREADEAYEEWMRMWFIERD